MVWISTYNTLSVIVLTFIHVVIKFKKQRQMKQLITSWIIFNILKIFAVITKSLFGLQHIATAMVITQHLMDIHTNSMGLASTG